MRSLLRMSDQELAEQESAHGLRLFGAAGLAGLAGVLALLGMMSRYQPGDDAPLPGMDQPGGQIVLAGGLAVLMLIAARLVRHVMMKRLQWAIVISLVLHLALLLGLQTYFFSFSLPFSGDATAEFDPRPDVELPDYGGMEAADVAQQQWERTTPVDVQEQAHQDLERQVTEANANAEPERVERTRQEVAQIGSPERREQREQMERAAELEMQRQVQEARADQPQRTEAPQVDTARVEQPEIDARPMQRENRNPQTRDHDLQSPERSSAPRVAARTPRSRADVRPTEMVPVPVESRERSSSRAQAASAAAESVDVSTRSAASASPAERALDSARQATSQMPARSGSQSAPAGSRSTMRLATRSPSRASGTRSASGAAPASGGSVSTQRTAGSRSLTAAGTSAGAVNVSAATGSAGPTLAAGATASGVNRSRTGLPAGGGSTGGALSAQGSARSGTRNLQASSPGRRSTGGGAFAGPTAGSVNGAGNGSGQRATSGQPGAVGTRAEPVSVAGGSGTGSSDGGSGTGTGLLAGGPSATASQVGRTRGGLPASRGSASGRSGSFAGTPGSSRGSATGLRSGSRTGLAGRSDGPSARLSGTGAGGSTGTTMRRAGAAPAMAAGDLAAEQSGALVLSGPQAPAAGSGRGALVGPRTGLSRRSAGLPASGRGASSVARTRGGLPSRAGSAGLPARRSAGARPRLASESEIAGMIRRAAPGIIKRVDEVSPTFSLRRPEMRREAVRQLGGSETSETGVERGLEWLATHQYADGHWSVHDMNCKDHECGGHGTFDSDPAATGLALLAFLGAGQTHQEGKYADNVKRGLQWLVAQQKRNGDLFGKGAEFGWFYSHGMAAIALCEAYGMTRDPELRDPAQRSIDFISESQHPSFGGWRYKPRFESDTSVSGWQLMALKSGEMAGLSVPSSTYELVRHWIRSVESKENPGQFAYHFTLKPTLAMTAEGLLMRQYLGADRTDPSLIAGADYLRSRRPQAAARDVYYWYYATQVMFHMQGDHWRDWNEALREMLVETQSKDGPTRGSWSASTPTKDRWGQAGGRHYVTCLNLLMLEVYYRHLPLYLELSDSPSSPRSVTDRSSN